MKQKIVFVMLVTWSWSCPIGVWKYPALNSTIYFIELCSRNIAGRFRSPNNKEEETSLLPEATPKATQYNTKWGRKVFEELHLRRQNKCAMLEIVGVAGLKCDDVEDLTIYSSTCRQLR